MRSGILLRSGHEHGGYLTGLIDLTKFLPSGMVGILQCPLYNELQGEILGVYKPKTRFGSGSSLEQI